MLITSNVSAATQADTQNVTFEEEEQNNSNHMDGNYSEKFVCVLAFEFKW